MLAGYELWAWWKDKISQEYLNFSARQLVPESTEQEQVSGRQNIFGLTVLAITLGLVGLLIIGLGIVAQEAKGLVIIMGTVVVLLSLLLHPRFRMQKKPS